jgi:hypothetical protein
VRTVAIVVLVAAAAAVGVVLLGHTGGQSSVPVFRTVSARASFDPPQIQFGDPVTARVVVLVDGGAPVSVAPDLAPLTRLGTPQTTRARRGRLDVVTTTIRAACLAQQCVAKQVRLAPVRITVGRRTTTTRFPALHVHSRVTEADLAGGAPQFRGDVRPPAPTYRIAPGTLAILLDVLAALLAAAAVLLGAREIVRIVRRRRAAAPPTELELALLRARESEARPAPDRRRALGQLARLLDRRDAKLADAARDLAWSEPAPERDSMSTLVTEVERTVAE